MTTLVLFKDRDRDVWRVGGRTRDGEELLVCDNPQDTDDTGTPGPTRFPWTRRTVEKWFGPLVRTEVPRVLEPTSLVLCDGTVLEPTSLVLCDGTVLVPADVAVTA